MKHFYLSLLCYLFVLSSCTRKEIEFGAIPDNAYTNLAYIDTVRVQLSTLLTDSFATNADTAFLLGRYADTYLGTVTARPFLHINVPSAFSDIPSSAVFDSLSLIIKPNGYYYGDTSRAQTISVYELSDAIAFTYNSRLYNTSNIPVKPVPLGARTVRISPAETDSVIIRLSNSKGLELFDKLRHRTSDITSQTEFLNYFKGISLAVADIDTAAVFGLLGAAGSMIMRVHYHHTLPYPEAAFIDFNSLANDYSFTQVLPERTNTGLTPVVPGLSELFPSTTKQMSFLQPGTGLTLKMIFPSLKKILDKGNGSLVKLLKAELIVKPKYLSFDRYQHKLPAMLGLAQTDETNLIGSFLVDSTGLATLAAAPVLDEVYDVNNYYRFTVTSYINYLLTTAGTEDDGLCLMQQSAIPRNLSRMVVNAGTGKDAGVMLLLYVLNVNK